MSVLKAVVLFLRGILSDKAQIAVENLALRQQLSILRRRAKRPRLHTRDRVFWVWLSKLWGDWRQVLLIVKPETVVRWHRQGFRLYWRWKSSGRRCGRPRTDREVRRLIRRMSRENPTWGVPRIQSELALLGHDVAEVTVAKYRVRGRRPPSQTWRTFLKNHAGETAAIDFFTVTTATFRVLFCFIVLSHDRRKIVHFNVTANPTAEWTGQQIVEAFPWDTAPRFLIRDNDSIYGADFRRRVDGMQIEQVPIAPQSPWQNPYAERVIGSIRRECLDYMIVLDERHLRRIIAAYIEYYHGSRPHITLDRNAPVPREVEPPSAGTVVAIPQVGGLHHRYARAA